jgi:Prealbumin-like fold domain
MLIKQRARSEHQHGHEHANGLVLARRRGDLDCTFTNTKQTGALRIRKNSTKTGNPLVSNDGAVFSYDGTLVTDNGTGDENADVGEVCVSGLATGDYTVNESTPPLGYGGASPTDQSVTVVAGTNCSDNPPPAAATATFTNPPLADIQVSSATAARERRRRTATSTAQHHGDRVDHAGDRLG